MKPYRNLNLKTIIIGAPKNKKTKKLCLTYTRIGKLAIAWENAVFGCFAQDRALQLHSHAL